MKKYEVRYGDYDKFKIFKTDDFEQGLRAYDKIKKFAENHDLTWTIALFDVMPAQWLIKTVTTNPEQYFG